MLSKLTLSNEVKANYDPIPHFLKLKQLPLSLCYPPESILRQAPKTSTHP